MREFFTYVVLGYFLKTAPLKSVGSKDSVYHKADTFSYHLGLSDVAEVKFRASGGHQSGQGPGEKTFEMMTFLKIGDRHTERQ